MSCQLSILFSGAEGTRLDLHMPHHGLTSSELDDIVVGLTKKQLMVITYEEQYEITLSKRILEGIRKTFSLGPPFLPFYAKITALGGEAWEEWAGPDWSHFYDDFWDDTFAIDEGYSLRLVEISCSSADKSEMIIEYFRQCYGYEVYASNDINQLTPWQPTPWKLLGEGVMRRLLINSEAPMSDSKIRAPGFNEQVRRFRQWYQRGFGDFAIERLDIANEEKSLGK